MAQANLRVQSLIKKYGKKTALKDISLTAYAGEVLAVLGKNGAGKTTLINSILGMRSFAAEHLELFGQRLSGQQRPLAIRQRIGIMMQLGTLNANLTVAEQLDLFCSYYSAGLQPQTLLEQFNLTAIARQRFGNLSGGQRQQVLFAIALAGRPDLLFLDEPTVGMDVEARHGLWQHIKGCRQRGCAVVLTTHYIEEAERLADRVAILREGRLIAQGSVQEVVADHGSLEAAYLNLIQDYAHA